MQAKRHQMGVIKGVRVVIKFERGTKTMIAFHFDSHSNAAALIDSLYDLSTCSCVFACFVALIRSSASVALCSRCSLINRNLIKNQRRRHCWRNYIPSDADFAVLWAACMQMHTRTTRENRCSVRIEIDMGDGKSSWRWNEERKMEK